MNFIRGQARGRLRVLGYFLWMLISLEACGTYSEVKVKIDDKSNGVSIIDCGIKPGDVVVIGLVSGDSVKGKILSLSKNEIYLGGRGNYGYQNLVIELRDIESIAVRAESDAQINTIWLLGVFGGVVYGVLFMLGSIKS